MGFRINPIPQQGGVQTIQQAIYQSHNSPCGNSPFILTPIGNLDMTYADIQGYVNYGLEQENIGPLFRAVQDTAQVYLQTESAFGSDDQRRYYAAVNEYGAAFAQNIVDHLAVVRPDIFSDLCQFSIYDSSGILIYDSKLGGVVEKIDDQYEFVRVPIAPAYHHPWGETYDLWSMVFFPLNIVLTDLTRAPYILARESQFAVNQTSLPESIQSISSAIVDTANTRTATSGGWGFSARQSIFAGFSYYACVIVPIYNPIDKTKGIVEYVFARMGISSAAKNDG